MAEMSVIGKYIDRCCLYMMMTFIFLVIFNREI